MKRRIRKNIYGNWRGYVGRSAAQDFGTDEVSAGYWLLTGVVDFYAGYADDCINQCKSAAHASI